MSVETYRRSNAGIVVARSNKIIIPLRPKTATQIVCDLHFPSLKSTENAQIISNIQKTMNNINQAAVDSFSILVKIVIFAEIKVKRATKMAKHSKSFILFSS